MTRGKVVVSWRDYVDYYGDVLGMYLRRDHLEAHTRATDDYPRFRCSVCEAAITVDPTAGVEYGHLNRSRGTWTGGKCPHLSD